MAAPAVSPDSQTPMLGRPRTSRSHVRTTPASGLERRPRRASARSVARADSRARTSGAAPREERRRRSPARLRSARRCIGAPRTTGRRRRSRRRLGDRQLQVGHLDRAPRARQLAVQRLGEATNGGLRGAVRALQGDPFGGPPRSRSGRSRRRFGRACAGAPPACRGRSRGSSPPSPAGTRRASSRAPARRSRTSRR